MNLIAGFLDKAAELGPRPAIITGAGETISYEQLALRSGRLAASLRGQGVQRGDRVLVALPVEPEVNEISAGCSGARTSSGSPSVAPNCSRLVPQSRGTK